MLTYTFSAREKFMLAVLAFVGVIIAWYQFVFVNYQNQMNSLESELATVEEEILLSQSRAEALHKMKAKVEEYKAQGIRWTNTKAKAMRPCIFRPTTTRRTSWHTSTVCSRRPLAIRCRLTIRPFRRMTGRCIAWVPSPTLQIPTSPHAPLQSPLRGGHTPVRSPP